MAIATEQLEAIRQEITHAFSDDSRISIAAADGNPPEKYEVTYLVEGLQKTESGTIEKTDRHTITISIPFGYPHFPPSCKPKSPIFHPDFDPAAICIGDFWEKNRSIVDLIRHIGEMITGAYYSTTNAFNEEAAQWYSENFPEVVDKEAEAFDESLLDSADLGLAAGSDDDFTTLLEDDPDDSNRDDLLESFEPPTADGVEPALSFVNDDRGAAASEAESLGDIFQESDFDFEESPQSPASDDELSRLELEDSDRDLPAVEDVEDDIDVEHFQDLVAQKRFFGLDKELSMLPADSAFDGKEALAEQAAVTLEKAQSLYTQALEFEHKGEPEKALKCFKKIESYTTDYPGLYEDISRMTQALELLGGWTDATEPSTLDIKTPDWPAAATKSKASKPSSSQPEEPGSPHSPAANLSPETSSENDTGRTFFEDGDKQKSSIPFYVLGIILLLIGGAIGLNYYFSSSKLAQAQQRFDQCQNSLGQNRFTDAELQCESALGLGKQVKLFKSGERDRLIMEIQKTLRAKHLTEGLAGNLMLDGEYYPKQVVANILAFREAKK
ncbi:MAG: ubiquitin-conjugating enzyme E2, partial [Desulfofustis sp.]